ncbi:MAG: hypothetical protein DGJ47_000460 [Rickettsiaceae bacterium]
MPKENILLIKPKNITLENISTFQAIPLDHFDILDKNKESPLEQQQNLLSHNHNDFINVLRFNKDLKNSLSQKYLNCKPNKKLSNFQLVLIAKNTLTKDQLNKVETSLQIFNQDKDKICELINKKTECADKLKEYNDIHKEYDAISEEYRTNAEGWFEWFTNIITFNIFYNNSDQKNANSDEHYQNKHTAESIKYVLTHFQNGQEWHLKISVDKYIEDLNNIMNKKTTEMAPYQLHKEVAKDTAYLEKAKCCTTKLQTYNKELISLCIEYKDLKKEFPTYNPKNTDDNPDIITEPEDSWFSYIFHTITFNMLRKTNNTIQFDNDLKLNDVLGEIEMFDDDADTLLSGNGGTDADSTSSSE